MTDHATNERATNREMEKEILKRAPKFIANWVLFQLLPVFYAAFFLGRHYISKWGQQACLCRRDIRTCLIKGRDQLAIEAAAPPRTLCCTFCGMTPKSFFGSTDFYPSLQATLFMGNLLYLATLSKSLMIFGRQTQFHTL